MSGDPWTQVTVPVRAINFDSIISIQGTVAFDSSKLSFVGVQGFGLPSMTNANFGTAYIANGKLTFSWNEQSLNPITVADSSILFEVVFNITGAPGDQVPILIVGSPTLIEVVDWTFTPIPYLTRSGNVSINLPPSIEIFADSVSGMPSQTVAVPVRVNGFQQMETMTGTVQWDPNIAVYDTLTVGSLPAYDINNFGLTQAAQGIITFTWSDWPMLTPSIPDSGILFTLYLEVVGVPGTGTSIAFPDTPTQRQFIQWTSIVMQDTATNGHVQVLDTVVGMPQSLGTQWSIHPNPVRPGLSPFRIEVPSGPEDVTGIKLVQANGQVLENAVEWVHQGPTLICTIKTPVAEGLWFLRLETAAGPQYGRLIIDNE